ncbi:hypothetical protein IAE22_32745, partial [Bacillus sp. S34]|nr:hypothetical protein [Bacillus sp. S34]
MLIVDDHALVRSGLRAVLDATDDCQVVGEASTGEEAVPPKPATVALVAAAHYH